jgi:dynein heavy chain
LNGDVKWALSSGFNLTPISWRFDHQAYIQNPHLISVSPFLRYDFNNSDLECALQNLKNFLEEQPEIPWPALLYVTGEITYGGRVTDDQDRRCLMSILQQYYTPQVLDDSYAFTPNGIYRVPPETDQNGYTEFIKGLPLTEGPAVFGMHENANITFQLQETGKIVETVLNMQPRLVSGTGLGKTPDEVVSELAQEIATGLPAPLTRAEAGATTFSPGPGGRLNSLSVVLLQESERFNKLLRVMTNSLAELQRAIKGLVVMSAELEAMYRSFLNNQVPAVWAAVAYPSLKPLSSWVKDFQQRMVFMREWMVSGEPKCFWLPGFFFPQGFMTGEPLNPIALFDRNNKNP